MNESESEIKEIVKKSYTEAVTKPNSGCCGSGNIQESMKGSLVKLAGYSEEDLKNLPPDSVENAFGCGNPLAFAGVKEGEVVVDIGSGAGIDCLLAAEKVGPNGKVIGIDMTPVMIEKARGNAKKAGLTNVEFRLGDADRLPVENNSADWIISNCVINLAPDKDKVFREIARVLKPGGQVSITDIVTRGDLPQPIRDNVEALVGCLAGALDENVYLEKMRQAGLVEVAVVNRIIYSGNQILSLVGVDGSEIPETSSSCGCGTMDRALFEPYLNEIDGKIWSAKIIARKP
jgi:SAM-dependent methyltransferase